MKKWMIGLLMVVLATGVWAGESDFQINADAPGTYVESGGTQYLLSTGDEEITATFDPETNELDLDIENMEEGFYYLIETALILEKKIQGQWVDFDIIEPQVMMMYIEPATSSSIPGYSACSGVDEMECMWSNCTMGNLCETAGDNFFVIEVSGFCNASCGCSISAPLCPTEIGFIEYIHQWHDECDRNGQSQRCTARIYAQKSTIELM